MMVSRRGGKKGSLREKSRRKRGRGRERVS